MNSDNGGRRKKEERGKRGPKFDPLLFKWPELTESTPQKKKFKKKNHHEEWMKIFRSFKKIDDINFKKKKKIMILKKIFLGDDQGQRYDFS